MGQVSVGEVVQTMLFVWSVRGTDRSVGLLQVNWPGYTQEVPEPVVTARVRAANDSSHVSDFTGPDSNSRERGADSNSRGRVLTVTAGGGVRTVTARRGC